MGITVNNPEALSWKHPNIGGICTKAGVVTSWPESLPELTQSDVDTWEVEYAAHLVNEQVKADVAETDKVMPRSTEDLIDVLVSKGTIALTDLPQKTQDVLTDKKSKRNKVKK